MELFGIKVRISRSLPEGTMLIYNELEAAKALRYRDGKIEFEPMDPRFLMKIVLGPKPDWAKP